MLCVLALEVLLAALDRPCAAKERTTEALGLVVTIEGAKSLRSECEVTCAAEEERHKIGIAALKYAMAGAIQALVAPEIEF